MSNQFYNNTATRMGGALYYDYRRPVLSQNTYINNTALYGHNIASYPVRIANVDNMNQSISLSNVGSGIYLHDSLSSSNTSYLKLALVDYDGQIMVLSNNTKISIINTDNSSSVIGTSEMVTTQGVAQFDNIGFVNMPGSSNVMFEASSEDIDNDKVSKLDLAIDNTITVNFRY